MNKQKRRKSRNLAKLLSSILVLAIFIVPGYSTARWVAGVFENTDHRSVGVVVPKVIREADATDKPLMPFKEPIVTIAFDDGWETVYTHAFPLLQKYGFSSTQYIITNTFKDPLYMSVAQLHSMQDAGHEIASHTVSHLDLTQLTDDDLDWQLQESKRELTDKFGDVQDFASPLGAYNKRTLAIISKYYRSHKNAEGDPDSGPLQSVNVGTSFDPLNMRSYSIRVTTDDEQIHKLLKDTIDNNGWLILTYHQIDSSGEEYSVTPETFEHQLGIMSKSSIRSANLAEVLSQINAQKRAGN